MTTMIGMLLALAGCPGGGGMDEMMRAVPAGDGAVCVPQGLWHGTVCNNISCAIGTEGADEVCQGTVHSRNAQIGISTFPENSTLTVCRHDRRQRGRH